jgi:putative transposase
MITSIQRGLREDGYQVSISQLCRWFDVPRRTVYYRRTKSAPRLRTEVVEPIKELIEKEPSFGYRTVANLLRRLWASQRLQLSRRRPRKRIATGRPRPLAPSSANQAWPYDLVFDACANGQQLKCLTLIEGFTKEALAIDVAGSIRWARVVEVLYQIISEREAPRYLRSDNRPKFVATALLK